MEGKVIWKDGISFTGVGGSGFEMPLGTSVENGGMDDGFRPMELILVGLAGCTAMDVISILKKKQQDVTGFEVRVTGERAENHPRVFTHIEIEYLIRGRRVDPEAANRAVELSTTKYCSVNAMLSQSVSIEHKITIQED